MTVDEKTKKTTGVLKISVATAFFLALVKIFTGILTHSLSILASALDSLLDVASSVVNLIAAQEASKPPDKEHAYGHEKIESLAGLFQSVFIGLSGLYLVFESIRRFFAGTTVDNPELGMGVMLFTMIASLLLVLKIKSVNKSANSVILTTEKLHYGIDILTNLGVIVALFLVKVTGAVWWDLLLSILISLYILKEAGEILKRCIDELIDRSLPDEEVAKIKQMVLAFDPALVGIHNFRSRKVGERIFLDFHVEIAGEDDFKRAHTMTESLITHVRKEYPQADLTVHYDPEGED